MILFMRLLKVEEMIEKIKSMILRFKWWWSYESCYVARKDEGYAVFGMCGGTVGGTRNTGYLSEECISCPYYTDIRND